MSIPSPYFEDFTSRDEISYRIPNRESKSAPRKVTFTKANMCWLYSMKLLARGPRNPDSRPSVIIKNIKKDLITLDAYVFVINYIIDGIMTHKRAASSNLIILMQSILENAEHIIPTSMTAIAGYPSPGYPADILHALDPNKVSALLLLLHTKISSRAELVTNDAIHKAFREELSTYRSSKRLEIIGTYYSEMLADLRSEDRSRLDELDTQSKLTETLYRFTAIKLGLSPFLSDTLLPLDPTGWIEHLRRNGPTIVSGKFGSGFYRSEAADKEEYVHARKVFSYDEHSRKEESRIQHSIIITGVKRNAEDSNKSIIYFIDPNRPSVSSTDEKGIIFAIEFAAFQAALNTKQTAYHAAPPDGASIIPKLTS